MRSALLTSSCARSETRGEETSFPLYTTEASQKHREALVPETRAKRLLLPTAQQSPHGVRHQHTLACGAQNPAGLKDTARTPPTIKTSISKAASYQYHLSATSRSEGSSSSPSSAPRLGPALILVSPLHLHIRPPLDHSSQEKKTVSVLSVFSVGSLFPTQYSATTLYTVPAFF